MAKIYLIFSLLCIAGWLWLAYHFTGASSGITPCIIKSVSGIPCPSCGTTRGIESLILGRYSEAILHNPLSLISLPLLIISSLLLLTDLLFKKRNFYTLYTRGEQLLKKRYISIIVILLIASNWIWNLIKNP